MPDESKLLLEGIKTKLNKLESVDDKLIKLDQLGKLDSVDARLGKFEGALHEYIENYVGTSNAQLNQLKKIRESANVQATTLDHIDAKFGKVEGALHEYIENYVGTSNAQVEQLKKIWESTTVQTTTLDSVNTKLNQLDQLSRLESVDSKLDQLGKLDQLKNVDSKLEQLNDTMTPAIPLALKAQGTEVKTLKSKLGELGFTIPEHELDEQGEQIFGVGTRDALLKFQKKYNLSLSGVFDDATKAALESALAPVGTKHRLEGRIFFENGLPAGGITLRVYNRGPFGNDKLFDDIKTDENGFYALPYDPGDKTVNLEVCLVHKKTEGNVEEEEEIYLSATKLNVDKHEVMNLVAPMSVQPADNTEYKRLNADLTEQIGELGNLANVQENDKRQDLTMLYQATGWDARLIALAATAVRLSAADETGIPQEALYGLLRAGLPTDKQQLARISVNAVEKALGKVKDAGIISLDDQQIDEAKTAFASFAQTARLAAKAPGALSSVGDLLAKSGLNETEQHKFEDLYFSHHGTATELWQKADDPNILGGTNEERTAKINGLRLQGKLAYLTLNNANLAESLQQEIDSPDSLRLLVDEGLYQSDAWKTRLNTLANNDEETLKEIIPPVYVDEETADRLDAYAADLARKVRLSFPTRVIRKMIEEGELHLGGRRDALATDVCTFLKNAEGLDFELGRVPVDAFIKQNQDEVFQGIAPEAVNATTQDIKLLQRLYQITPSDESLKAALKLGFTSAYDVVAFPYDVFFDCFGSRFPSLNEARLVYRKAQQVSSVTYNFFTAAKQMDSAPPVYAVSGTAERREQAKTELKDKLKDYPTMESLFGSLDFCECEHCRSVLSPAAYLVDLLQFLDPETLVWENFLSDWREKHNGDAYDGPLYQFKKPYDALVERRPDLPNLPLTCENTHTALPYIDIVNEILEYYVAKGTLEENAVHDTGTATTPELLAEPQNILPAAYGELKQARYPLALPFDLWLETVRRFFDHFETPFWRVLEVLRPADELFPPPTNPKPYYRAAIFAEYLGISPAEYNIFTDSNPLTTWFELYGYATEAEAFAALKSAKTLARRLGISYKELIELVRTGFINPQLNTLVILKKLRVDVSDVFRYKEEPGYPAFTPEERATFEKRLDELTQSFQASGFNTRTWLDTAWPNGDFNQILLLADPNAGCNFDLTTLLFASDKSAYVNGDDIYNDNSDAYALVFLKINLFVRLWKKLGWTMEETDRALQGFLPGEIEALTGATLGEAFQTALVYLAHLKALDERVKVGKNSRLKLLTFWSNLPTTGNNPLYAQLFLTQSVLKSDPVFDHPLGKYLCYFDAGSGQYKPFRWDTSQPEDAKTGNVSLKSHLLALQGALNLTADETAEILDDAGKNVDTVELSQNNVSLLYRYNLLAKGLKLSVHDLIALKSLSGLDPFTALSADPLTKLDDDHPFTQTIRFVEVAEKVKESGFKIEDLNYLLRHRFDPVGEYRDNPAALLTLVKTLAAGIRQIQAEHPVPNDPLSLTDDLLRQKLALIFLPDVVETFLGMLTGTVEYEAIQVNVLSADKLDPATFTQEPAIQVSYDEVRQTQHLIFRGVLLDAKKAQLNAAFPSPILAALLNTVQEQTRTFFEKHLEKSTIEGHTVGFLDTADFEMLFAAIPDGLSDKEKQDQIRTKRGKLIQVFLPFLQQTLIRQLVVQTLASSLNAEPALTEALLTNARLLTDPSLPGQPLLDAFSVVGETGVSAAFFASIDGTGVPLDTKTVSTVDTAGKPAGTNSACFESYLEIPVTGAYRFFAVIGKRDTEVELRFDHLPDPLFRGKAANDAEEISAFIELKANVPYRFTLKACSLGGGDIALLIQGETLPKDDLTRLTLYPQITIERVRRGQVLSAKVIQLIQELGLSEREVRYLLTHAADFDNLDLSKLPTRKADDSPAGATALFGQFLRLADYARLKHDLAGDTDDLIGIFEYARRTHPASADADKVKSSLLQEIHQRVADLTRRDVATVEETADHLGFKAQSTVAGDKLLVEASDFTHEKGIQRLWEALQVVEKLGVRVEALGRWTRPAPDFSIARDLKNMVKARYETENWQRIAQPIFDKLRQRQRDALVAYIMHKDGFERIEQLFEYFLIDPGMEPIVQTSRLRLAISSLQLFIQRCLLNLEKHVHPSAINSKHWQWMKRYRVWEANRKIFLFPENWLEPEFRDDKTHLFQELESALLQGDVSNDLVEDAFFHYLKKLEELARLDIVTMYCEEKPLDPASNTLHVIGRTYSEPHKYFYRRYAHQMWTPWEPVATEIEGDHVVAVVWRERLHLFWVTFLEKAKQDTSGQPIEIDIDNINIPTAVQKEVEIQLNWSEYFQGEWTTRESSGFGAPIRVAVSSNFDSRKVFIHVSKEYDNGEERAVYIHLGGEIGQAFRVVSKNSQPKIVARGGLQESPYPTILRDQPTRYTGSGALQVAFVERVRTEDNKEPETTITPKEIIQGIDGEFSLLLCANPSTTIDTIKWLASIAGAYLTQIAGSSPVRAEIEKLVSFVESLPLRFSDPSAHVTEAAFDEWSVIKTNILRLTNELQYSYWALYYLRHIVDTCIGTLTILVEHLLQRLSNSAAADAIAEEVRAEIRRFVSPFFYQDNQHTFFVEPTLTETTIEQWEEWVITISPPDVKLDNDDWWLEIPIDPFVPIWPPIQIDPGWIDPIDPRARFEFENKFDWLINPVTVLRFDEGLISQSGGLDLVGLPEVGNVTGFGTMVNVINPGSEFTPGSMVTAPSGPGLASGGFTVAGSGITVVGGSGVNSVILENLGHNVSPIREMSGANLTSGLFRR